MMKKNLKSRKNFQKSLKMKKIVKKKFSSFFHISPIVTKKDQPAFVKDRLKVSYSHNDCKTQGFINAGWSFFE